MKFREQVYVTHCHVAVVPREELTLIPYLYGKSYEKKIVCHFVDLSSTIGIFT